MLDLSFPRPGAQSPWLAIHETKHTWPYIYIEIHIKIYREREREREREKGMHNYAEIGGACMFICTYERMIINLYMYRILLHT